MHRADAGSRHLVGVRKLLCDPTEKAVSPLQTTERHFLVGMSQSNRIMSAGVNSHLGMSKGLQQVHTRCLVLVARLLGVLRTSDE